METLKDYAVDTNKLTLQEFLDRYKYQNNFFVRAYQIGLPKDKQAGFSFDCNEIHYMDSNPRILAFMAREPRRTWKRFLKQLLNVPYAYGNFYISEPCKKVDICPYNDMLGYVFTFETWTVEVTILPLLMPNMNLYTKYIFLNT